MKRPQPEIELIARGVLVKDGMLLACRNVRRGNLYLPGGHVDFCESARTALTREVMEELGLRSRAGRFLGVCEFTYERKGRTTCEVNLVFELKIPGASPSKRARSREKKLAFDWVPLKKLQRSKLLPALLRPWISRRLSSKADPDAFIGNYGK